VETIVKKIESPWEYYVIDNFFSLDDIEVIKEMTDFFPTIAEPNSRIRVRFGIASSYNVLELQQTDNALKRKHLSNIVKRKIFQNFSDHPQLSELMESYVQVEYSSLGKGFNYKIHSDAYSKFFSLVWYWKPEDKPSCGTRIYDKDKNFVEEIEWKYNRAFAFFNGEEKYHDFYSDKDERISMNFIFMTPKFAPPKPW